MLDARVRTTLLDYQAGRCDLETAAQTLLTVRREQGCLTLMEAPDSPSAQRALVARYRELVRLEFGES
ncbi:MAG TPA: hypothetical protein VGE27_03260 [Gemmatimonas sp.]|uniref:hypothetical protein n=1 Tax=Gemmatimonas sp. TaxID=1962908 RepID=UPI002ED7E8EB